MVKQDNFRFINSLTGNAIGYLSLPATAGPEETTKLLEMKRIHLAVLNQLYVGLIYWERQADTPILP